MRENKSKLVFKWVGINILFVAQGRASTECLRCSLETITLLIGYELIEILRFFFFFKGRAIYSNFIGLLLPEDA